MKTFQLPDKENKARYVQDQFDRIAAGYDLTNDLISFGMHRLWKARALDVLIAGKPGHYLDCCTGTGDLAIAACSRGARVTGLDFSAGMLEVARHRQAKSAIPEDRLNFLEGDAQALPFPDATFDGAIISFGLRNLTDLERGLAELSRVVKPGSRVVNLDLGKPEPPVFAPLFYFFFDNVVPVIGDFVQKDRSAYTYLPESRKTYPDPCRLSSMFAAAGLADVHHEKLALGSVALHYGTAGKRADVG